MNPYSRWPAWTQSIRWTVTDNHPEPDDDNDDQTEALEEGEEADYLEGTEEPEWFEVNDGSDEDPTTGTYDVDASEDDIPF